ncbi:hypothetical protein LTR85_009524 [Meristemomyces frigidus]|nr:hypothetical protein LTR85_009524 [Meristemomyces frigidus]
MSPPAARDYVVVAEELQAAKWNLNYEENKVKSTQKSLNNMYKKKRDALAEVRRFNPGNYAFVLSEREKLEKDARSSLQMHEANVPVHRSEVDVLEKELKSLKKPEENDAEETERSVLPKKTNVGGAISATKQTKSAAATAKPAVQTTVLPKQLSVKQALKEVESAYNNLAMAQSKGGRLTITKWQKRYDDAAKALVAAYAADGTIIEPEKLNGRPTPTGLKAAAAASKRAAGARRRKVTDVAGTADPLQPSRPNVAAPPASSAERDRCEAPPDKKRKRGDELEAVSAAKKAKPTTEPTLPPRKARYSGIVNKPILQQVLDAKRKRKSLSPREAAQVKAFKEMREKSNYMAHMSASSGNDSKAPSAARKRPAEDSDTNTRPAKRVMQNGGRLKGLTNRRQACFSNAAIQVIDASLGAEHVSQLHSDDRPRPHSFGMREEDCVRKRALMQQLKNAIADAAARGRLPLSAYLGQLLKDLRSPAPEAGQRKSTNAPVSPLLLQQVFAYSKPDRNELAGDDMQDASEWLLRVLQEVFEEKPLLRALFELKQRTIVRCRAQGCNHSHDVASADEITFHVAVEEQEGVVPLQSLITDALRADQLPDDYACEGCKHLGTLEKKQIYTGLPDNLIVLIDRIDPETEKKKATRIGLEFKDIFVGNEQYRMNAFVRHRSNNRMIKTGHYTAFRKDEGKWWELDDANVRPASERGMADDQNNQSSFLLLQKVQQ